MVVWLTEQSIKATLSNMKIVDARRVQTRFSIMNYESFVHIHLITFMSSSNASFSYDHPSQTDFLSIRRIRSVNALVMHIVNTNDVSF